jgi:hypothetical protein
LRIIDINGKEREVEYAKRIPHQVPDAQGVMYTSFYVEVLIIGPRGPRVEWYPIEDFMAKNPGVILGN